MQAQRRARDSATGKSVVVGGMTYKQWAKQKRAENKTVWDVYVKKGKRLSSDREQHAQYRKFLDKHISKELDDFQNLKYNEPEKWDELKRFAAYKRVNPESDKRFFDAEQAKNALLKAGKIHATGTFVTPPGGFVVRTSNIHATDRLAQRNITLEIAQSYINNAVFALKQRNGEIYAFYSQNGFAAVDNSGMLRTAGELNESGRELFNEAVKHIGNNK